jgi:hypothetical protein
MNHIPLTVIEDLDDAHANQDIDRLYELREESIHAYRHATSIRDIDMCRQWTRHGDAIQSARLAIIDRKAGNIESAMAHEAHFDRYLREAGL